MSKCVADYLAMGFDRKMAEYFSHGRRRIVRVIPNRDFTLTLTFDNGERRVYDVSPLIQQGTVFAPLCDWEIFSRAYLDEAHSVSWDIDPTVDSNIVWDNKIDLCPDTCYVDSISHDQYPTTA